MRCSLCLIACARFGLSEPELLDLLGNGGEPLPRRPWTPLHLAAENALAVRAGLLNFGHDYLRAAVHNRWLEEADTVRQFRLQLAGYFAAMTEPTNRKLDELPALLRDTAEWERLKDLLADLPTFLRLRSTERWKWELHGLWLALSERYDPLEVYRHTVAEAEPNLPPDRLAYVLNEAAVFHNDSGQYAEAEALFRRALAASERVSGTDDSNTLTSLNNLAALLSSKGDFLGAEAQYRRALEAMEGLLGLDHPLTLTCVNNLAVLLTKKAGYAEAELLYRRALKGRERVLGEHPDTLRSLSHLAGLLAEKADYAEAEPLYRRALNATERILGSEHPDTLETMRNLAGLLQRKGGYAEAELLLRGALKGRERVLGAEHRDTLVSVSDLAGLLAGNGDYARAEPLFCRALGAMDRVLGAEHPETLKSVNNLGFVLVSKGDYAAAEPLYRRALEGHLAISKSMGGEHRNLRDSIGNYEACLAALGHNTAAIRARMEEVLGRSGTATQSRRKSSARDRLRLVPKRS